MLATANKSPDEESIPKNDREERLKKREESRGDGFPEVDDLVGAGMGKVDSTDSSKPRESDADGDVATAAGEVRRRHVSCLCRKELRHAEGDRHDFR